MDTKIANIFCQKSSYMFETGEMPRILSKI